MVKCCRQFQVFNRYNAVLSNCSVGQFSTIHNGVCVGQDGALIPLCTTFLFFYLILTSYSFLLLTGFGFFMNEEGHILKKPQALHVRIGDNVEIGANTCIDRGSWRDTVIGDHTKIDNLVQVSFSAFMH
ncbi:hypothetical protein BHE74_00056391 [Ensete ventricosum]|nr:hypothetical protein BHE74_00056391 [Ensete ventricosum]